MKELLFSCFSKFEDVLLSACIKALAIQLLKVLSQPMRPCILRHKILARILLVSSNTLCYSSTSFIGKVPLMQIMLRL
jgi:hypothetical protein